MTFADCWTARERGFGENDVTITAIGFSLLNQSSLQVCRPETLDCTLESSWVQGWEVENETRLEFRVQFKNVGPKDFCIAMDTVMYGLGPDELDGFADAEDVETTYFFIYGGKPTSNDANSDNPPAYSNYDIRLENNASYVWLYFGAADPGTTAANQFDLNDPNPGNERVIHMIFMLLFTYQVDDGVSCYDAATQGTPYAQTIPFQALVVDLDP